MCLSRLAFPLVAVLAVLLALPVTGRAARPATAANLQRGLDGLVGASGGPPGAIATLYRNGRLTVVRAGRADIKRKGAPSTVDHMRIASVSKAFSGAIAMRLVHDGRLGLDDTIEQRLPNLPPAWAGVTVGQLLDHTSGVPDYTESDAFAKRVGRNPAGFLSPTTLIDFVRPDPLVFAPGSSYAYSNTDNVVVGLIAQAVTGRHYSDLLDDIVFGPGKLRQTSFPTRTTKLPAPFLHGYAVAPGEEDQDVTTSLSPSVAWASGGVVSTPAELNAFIRAYLGLRFFGAAQQREQMRFLPGGQSSPPGPGQNAAGLALFRYRTRCGTVYGHTGSLPGYVQFAAATADGRRAVTTTLNIPAPTGRLLKRLRAVQTTAVCALLR
jgi:D-alanyl-D-alanine carboxypeptidase